MAFPHDISRNCIKLHSIIIIIIVIVIISSRIDGLRTLLLTPAIKFQKTENH